MRLSQPIETVRVPVSSRPIVCAVVIGSQRLATSSSVMPLARRTSRIRGYHFLASNNLYGFSLSYTLVGNGKPPHDVKENEGSLMPTSPSYIERAIEDPAGELQQVRVHIGNRRCCGSTPAGI
jgi:hypothetical protein